MRQSNDIQDFQEGLRTNKYKYIEIYPGSEERFGIDCFASKSTGTIPITRYDFQKRQKVAVKMLAERHGVEYETLPMFDDKTSVQKEFEGWLAKIKAKNKDHKINHYERAVIFAKELAYGITKGYWKNEIGSLHGLPSPSTLPNLMDGRNSGRRRLLEYMQHRIGSGDRVPQGYRTRRGQWVQRLEDETDDMNLMLEIMLGIGVLKNVDVSNCENVYELTSEAFALLKKPKWHERHAELLSKISIVSVVFSTVAVILSIILMLRELGVV